MDIEFADDDLADLYTNPKSSGRYSQAVEKGFRKRIQFIVAAVDERDLYAMKSLHFEKLQGRGEHRSIRINDQWRIILEFLEAEREKVVRVISIEDYH